MTMDLDAVSVPGADLEVARWGAGEPVVFIQTALTADELQPLAEAPALEDGCRKVLYHRRGYEGSSATAGPGSIARDAQDCVALLGALGISRAHVVGVSYSGAVALQLAADAPTLVHSLTLIEPPPIHVARAPEFRAANQQLLQVRRDHGPLVALDDFLTRLVGADWRAEMEALLPGSVAQMEYDAITFFDTDVPALLDWQFGDAEIRRVACPVLHVGGTDSGPWFAEVRKLVRDWFPDADDVVIEGADHSLALTHVAEVAAAVRPFLRRHPLPA